MQHANLIAAAACLLALGGCAASASPEWDAQFGDHARILTAQQLLDPAAPARNAQQMPRTDGRSTREAMDRQVQSYRNPPPSNVINIGVGGGSSR